MYGTFLKGLFCYTMHSKILFNLISDRIDTLKTLCSKRRNKTRRPENKWISCMLSFYIHL